MEYFLKCFVYHKFSKESSITFSHLTKYFNIKINSNRIRKLVRISGNIVPSNHTP